MIKLNNLRVKFKNVYMIDRYQLNHIKSFVAIINLKIKMLEWR